MSAQASAQQPPAVEQKTAGTDSLDPQQDTQVHHTPLLMLITCPRFESRGQGSCAAGSHPLGRERGHRWQDRL